MQTVTSLLTELGLNEKEALVYSTLLRTGSLTISSLAEKSGIKRTTLYTVVEGMKQKDLILEDLSSIVQTYSACPIEVLKKNIQLERYVLQRKEALVLELDKVVEKEHLREPKTRKIVTVPQRNILPYLYERAEAWSESVESTSTDYVGFQDQLFAKKYAKWIDWYWKLPSSKNITLRMLSNQSVFEDTTMRKRRYDQRIIRYWKEGSEITASTWIAGEYVIITNLRDKPYSLIEIRDATIAESYRQIFEGMWKQIV